MTDVLGRIKDYNKFTPACTGVAGVNNNIVSVKLKVSGAETLISHTTATGINKIYFDAGVVVPGIYGAAVTVSASCRVFGVDFYGQPMSETITVVSTAVTGKKAFAKIYALQHVSSASTALPTVDVTYNPANPLGLPYINVGSLYEIKNGAKSASLGTTAAGSLSTTQSATSADPRGTYVVSGTPANGDEIEFVYNTTKYIFKNGSGVVVGGLEGLAHFFA